MPITLSNTSFYNTDYTMVYEARARTCATCVVNNREEQVWSNYSPVVICKWVKKATPRPALKEEEKAVKKVAEPARIGSYNKAYTFVVFIVVCVLTVAMAFVLGHYATM